MREIELDWAREGRTGVSEAVYCEPKSVQQIDAILGEAYQAGRSLLLTRLSEPAHAALNDSWGAALDYDPVSRTAFFGTVGRPLEPCPSMAIVAAGTSDMPVAREAMRTLQFHGSDPQVIADVGVAGLWRLLKRLPDLAECRVVIAVAGMEGALFSVLAGLIRAPVIAVPTSIGYGVAAGGQAALSSALASCAPGLLAVNIDNGFGAAAAALKIIDAGAGSARQATTE